MQTNRTSPLLFLLATIAAASALSGPRLAADPATPDTLLVQKPIWLTDLSVADKEWYDDNVLLVSGLGLPEQSSWVNDQSFKLGVDLAPVFAQGSTIQSFTIVYSLENANYAQASAENYTAHRLNDVFKGKSGNFSYSLDNAFLYNDGNKLAETYALNQVGGAAGNQLDKYRNNYSHSPVRDRRNQDQDRYNAQVRWDAPDFFFRPVSSLTYYNLNTYQFNTSVAPYKGYQDYIDRWDINGGADLGYTVAPGLAVFLGYRDGFQHQDQYSLGINSDQHFASNHYQRALLGLEGKLTDWLTVKASGGPDFRDYNASTAIDHDRTTRFYGDVQATAALSKDQSLTFAFKQWLFVSSTGLVPYDDISYSLAYHWNVTKQFGFDLGAKFLEANYTLGNDLAGSAPSLRDDIDYQGSAGITYAIIPNLIASVSYAYDKGANALSGLATNYAPNYRDFEHAVLSFGLQFKF